ncbi:hypothetical protein AAHC03_0893 [Spirometra sp. Aus1]
MPIVKQCICHLRSRAAFPPGSLFSVTRSTPLLASRSSHGSYQDSDNRPQENSLFRSLIGLSVIIGGTSAVVYFNKTARNYATEKYPQLNDYFAKVDTLLAQWQSKRPNFELPQWPKSAVIDDFSKTSSPDVSISETERKLSPSFPSVADVIREIEQVPVHLRGAKTDLQTAINDAERSAQEALADLRHLEMTTKKHIEEQQRLMGKQEVSRNMTEKLESAQKRAAASHEIAQRHLSELRSALDAAKTSASQKEAELVQNAIRRYSDLAYDLSGVVNEVRRLQNYLAISSTFANLEAEDRSKLYQGLKSILPKPTQDKLFVGEAGIEMTREELNSLLVMTLERIDKLFESLDASGVQAKQRFVQSLKNHSAVFNQLVRDSVERELSHERAKQELERFEWEKAARDHTDQELNLALARHGHHLAQMLRLKQEEMEHQFDYRLREALTEQKQALEGELRKWIKRMEAIEQVVDGRADIDRVAKETQALWLAVEALAFTLEMPFSKIGATGTPVRNELKPFYTTAPLREFINDVQKAATRSGNHEFALCIADSLPVEVLESGVWTRQGLLSRFNKVYDVCRSVALVDEAGCSLWSYFMSWLQSKLLFDSFSRRRLISRLPGAASPLLTPDSEITDGETPDTFCLLASAKAALMPASDAMVSVDSANCSDIEFAVRLLSQLRGQPAAVVADWLEDARRFLEVHQAVQALLAYTTAQNISTFEERL